LLSIKAELENVTDLVPAADDFEYFFGVRAYAISISRRSRLSLTLSFFPGEMHQL